MFEDPENKDHTAKVVSVQYVPNGRNLGKSACTCVDNQGRHYNRLEEGILYQGDIVYITERKSLIECIIDGVLICLCIFLALFVILGIFGVI